MHRPVVLLCMVGLGVSVASAGRWRCKARCSLGTAASAMLGGFQRLRCELCTSSREDYFVDGSVGKTTAWPHIGAGGCEEDSVIDCDRVQSR